MATLEQAAAFNTARENEDWADLSETFARSLLVDAETYIRGRYSIKEGMTEAEQLVFDGIVCRLAAVMAKEPVQVASQASIKKEAKEGAGFKKEIEYNSQGSDPYPYITAVIRPFLRNTSAGWGMGRMVRR